MSEDEGWRVISDAERVRRLADGPNLDLGAISRELRRTMALVAAIDDRID